MSLPHPIRYCKMFVNPLFIKPYEAKFTQYHFGMRKHFHIERWGNTDEYSGLFDDHIVSADSPIVTRYNSYGLIFEDLRTIIELNKIIEDILTSKYMFYKLRRLSKAPKWNLDLELLKIDLDTYNTLLIQSLFTTTIVTYAKWFTQSSGGNKTKLESRGILKNSPKAIIKTHELIMAYRNFYFAHSGPTALEKNFPLYIIDPKKPNEEHLFSIPQKTRVPSLAEVRKFHRLFCIVITHVNKKMQTMKPNVINVIKEEVKKSEENKVRKSPQKK